MTTTILHGDCRELLLTLPERHFQTVVTSPPYWRLREYTDDPREIGREPTPAEYVAALVEVFALVWRVLRDDGTLWLNLGDAYANDAKWGGATSGKHAAGLHGQAGPGRRKVETGLPPKSLIGLPWRVAFALQDAGWVLRNDNVWYKRNAMPEGAAAQDRCARDHEYVFMFSKRGDYFFDADAIAQPVLKGSAGSSFVSGKTGVAGLGRVSQKPRAERDLRHPRTVWDIPTQPLRDEHYAPMPQALAERCIRAGSHPGDAVLDPFGGSGTTGRVAERLQRDATLIELGNYIELAERRTDDVQVELFV